MSKFILIIFIFLILVWRLAAAKGGRLSQPKNLFARRIDQLLPEPQASLLNGMLWGIKANMPDDFYSALKRTGTLHIIVISGTNITILINVLARGFYFLGRRQSVLLTIAFISLFIWFIGFEPPLLRAGLMGAISLLTVYFGRREYSLLTLIGVALTMLLFNPALWQSLSFQLSFSATLGLIMVDWLWPIQRFSHNLRRSGLSDENAVNTTANAWLGWLEQWRPLWVMLKFDLLTSLAAQLFTLPIILANFGQLSLIAPLANLSVGWLVPIITSLGMIFSLTGVLIAPLARMGMILLWPMLTYFANVITLLSRVPMASVYFGQTGPVFALFYYLGLLGVIVIIYKSTSKRKTQNAKLKRKTQN